MIGRILRKLRFAVILLRCGGVGPFLHQLRRQVYSEATFLGMERDLSEDVVRAQCQVRYGLRLASVEDMDEIVECAKGQGRESAHELIQRRWFYESGFNDCYVAREEDTGQICHVQWLVSSRENGKDGFESRLPSLSDDEVLIENAFTTLARRRRGVMTSVVSDLADFARSKGVRRMLAYVRDDNIPSLRALETAGFSVFERVPEIKFLFMTRRRHLRGGCEAGDAA